MLGERFEAGLRGDGLLVAFEKNRGGGGVGIRVEREDGGGLVGGGFYQGGFDLARHREFKLKY